MPVKIVTDSSSDIPGDIARELDITVVPLYISFGTETLRDGVDIQPDEFYRRLVNDPVHPTTAAASPGDFAEIYEKLSHNADGIISIHLSRKVSATFDAALKGRELVSGKNCPVEVVDSKLVTIALGLVAIAAAKAARAGKTMQNTLDHVNEVIPCIRVYGFLDSLKYIAKGGRLGRAGPFLSSVLPVKPVLTMKDGSLAPTGVVRTRSKGIERLQELVRSTLHVKEIGIAHSADDQEIKSFIERLKSFLPDIRPTVTQLGPALGVHGGPGAILLAIQRESPAAGAGLEAGERKPAVSLPSLQSIRDSFAQRKSRGSGHTSQCSLMPLNAV